MDGEIYASVRKVHQRVVSILTSSLGFAAMAFTDTQERRCPPCNWLEKILEQYDEGDITVQQFTFNRHKKGIDEYFRTPTTQDLFTSLFDCLSRLASFALILKVCMELLQKGHSEDILHKTCVDKLVELLPKVHDQLLEKIRNKLALMKEEIFKCLQDRRGSIAWQKNIQRLKRKYPSLEPIARQNSSVLPLTHKLRESSSFGSHRRPLNARAIRNWLGDLEYLCDLERQDTVLGAEYQIEFMGSESSEIDAKSEVSEEVIHPLVEVPSLVVVEENSSDRVSTISEGDEELPVEDGQFAMEEKKDVESSREVFQKQLKQEADDLFKIGDHTAAFRKLDEAYEEARKAVSKFDNQENGAQQRVRLSSASSEGLQDHVEFSRKIQSEYAAQDVENMENEQRQEVLDEIISSEGAFLDSLKIARTELIKPITDQILSKRRSEALFRLFLRFEDLHSVILQNLQYSDASDAFEKSATYLSLHAKYSDDFGNVLKSLQTISHRLTVRRFLQKREQQGCEDLVSYLFLPLHRVPAYEILLAKLRRCTSAKHPKRATLDRAFEKIRQISNHINESRSHFETMIEILKRQYSINGIQHNLLDNPDRSIRKEGILSTRTGGLFCAGLTERGHFILFNDALLWSTSSKYRGCIQLKGASLKRILKERTIRLSGDALFNDGPTPQLSWTLYCSNKKNFTSWSNALYTAISDLTDGGNPLIDSLVGDKEDVPENGYSADNYVRVFPQPRNQREIANSSINIEDFIFEEVGSDLLDDESDDDLKVDDLACRSLLLTQTWSQAVLDTEKRSGRKMKKIRDMDLQEFNNLLRWLDADKQTSQGASLSSQSSQSNQPIYDCLNGKELPYKKGALRMKGNVYLGGGPVPKGHVFKHFYYCKHCLANHSATTLCKRPRSDGESALSPSRFGSVSSSGSAGVGYHWVKYADNSKRKSNSTL